LPPLPLHEHTYTLAAIELRFLDPMQNGNEALHGSTTADILLPIQIDLTPDVAILQDSITVTVSFSSGTATGMYNYSPQL